MLYASYQLQGASTAWWKNHQAILGEGQTLTWAAFKKAFRDYHILVGLMDIKKSEFYKLKQGNINMMEFLHHFNYLARYTASEIPDEGRKVAQF